MAVAEARDARLEIVLYVDTFGRPDQDMHAAAEVKRAVHVATGKPIECYLVDADGKQAAVPDWDELE